nr:MAG TPA: hypothetical protein [Caudoviricetes sp.]
MSASTIVVHVTSRCRRTGRKTRQKGRIELTGRR